MNHTRKYIFIFIIHAAHSLSKGKYISEVMDAFVSRVVPSHNINVFMLDRQENYVREIKKHTFLYIHVEVHTHITIKSLKNFYKVLISFGVRSRNL